ncbi:MAG: hypothetical protein J6I48_10355 [Lachnospira sp.]|nr:hypothetical protein [Lachnospira sp.]
MKYNNLDDIFYLEDLFIVWQAEQAKEKEYKNDKVDIRSFSRDGFVDEKMWSSSFLNGKRVLYIAREANATGQRLVDDGRFYLKDEESSQKKKIFQRIIAIQNIIKARLDGNIKDEVHEKVIEIFGHACKHKDFGNGRFVRNIYEQALMNQTLRIARSTGQPSEKELRTLEAEDFNNLEVKETSEKEGRVIGFQCNE